MSSFMTLPPLKYARTFSRPPSSPPTLDAPEKVLMAPGPSARTAILLSAFSAPHSTSAPMPAAFSLATPSPNRTGSTRWRARHAPRSSAAA
ncbi:putative acyl transferase domain protein [Burkholderia sp. ABCPW 111]|nr:putative acyl transferase domain protein [Burkholderia sp. ABCPW 111]